MKKLIIFSAAALLATAAGAQIRSGIITYDEVTHLNLDLLPAAAAQFRDMIPKEAHHTATLRFSPEAAIYHHAASPAPDSKNAAADDGQTRMTVTMESDDDNDIFYNDLKSGRITQQKDLLGRKFIIEDAAKKRSWRNTGRQKKILTYDCQEAVSTTDQDTITAWYTTAIPMALGPKDVAGLPGMILETSYKNESGYLTITAIKVEASFEGMPAAPQKGKKVTREEFKALEAVKEKELKSQYGGQGGTIIIGN